LPFRPYHTHNEQQPLKPGQVYELDIEIVPTSIVVPKGYRVGLTVRGRDYVYPGGSGGKLSNMKNEFTGCGPFLHDDPRDRPVAIYGGRTTIHLGGGRESFVLLPIIPDQAKAKKAAPPKRGQTNETKSDLRSGIRQVGTTPLSSSESQSVCALPQTRCALDRRRGTYKPSRAIIGAG
jgi:hypothetical protein